MQHESPWATFFNGHAPQYEENVFTRNTTAEVRFLWEELGLASGSTILDIGCGTGRHAIELARRGCAVTGVDISAGMLAEAARNAEAAGVQVNWIECDATTYRPDRMFDAVICLCEGAFGLLGQGDDPIRQPLAILRQTSEALKPGAKCLFTVLNGYRIARNHAPEDVGKGFFDPLALTEVSDVPLPASMGDVFLRERGFVPTELQLLFEMTGLEVLHVWGGTAGNWGHRAIELDEYEIMVVGRKPGTASQSRMPTT
jgi:cyclopropane fatty-acyl-phospholipid synthase-like methyltransferase